MCGKEEDYFFNLNNFRDQFDSDEEDKLRSVLGDALLRYNINVCTFYQDTMWFISKDYTNGIELKCDRFLYYC